MAEDMKLTIRGEQFVTDVTGDVILLTTNANLDFFATCPNWLGDGTFDTAPKDWPGSCTPFMAYYILLIPYH